MRHETTISDSRTLILHQARRLFAAHGYEGTSIREMAEACGLAKASLYHHFHNKRDLYFQVLEVDAANLVLALQQASQVGTTSRERIYSIARAYAHVLTSSDNLIPLAVREPTVPHHELYNFLKRWRDPMLAPIRRVIADGIACDELREVEPDLATHFLFGLLNIFITHGMFLDDESTGLGPDALDKVVTLFLEGIARRDQ
jgi:AcrR family transcriptional regulator